jgi:hypothetical protein
VKLIPPFSLLSLFAKTVIKPVSINKTKNCKTHIQACPEKDFSPERSRMG